MSALGDLERDVMDQLWSADEGFSAPDLRQRLLESTGREAALTTVMTVLSRLEKKGMVVRDRTVRPHEYRSAFSRAEHTARLMTEALGTAASDSEAVLTRFVGSVSASQAQTLRQLLSAL